MSQNLPFQLPNGWSAIQLPGGGLTIMPPGTSAPAPSQTQNPPDLSGVLSALAPVLGAINPQLGAILPIIGVVLQILHMLTTQNNAAIASGTPNQALQIVHDGAWSQALGAFAPPS